MEMKQLTIKAMQDYVLTRVDDPSDVAAVNQVVFSRLDELLGDTIGWSYDRPAASYAGYGDEQFLTSEVEVNLYVDGSPVVTIACLNWLCKNGVVTTCWHFNEKTGEYFPQRMLWN